MSGPLEGFRILDLTTMISGPYATMILADQGAEVIKVEPPGIGDFVRATGNRQGGFSANFLNNNRNKRSVTIDLKSEDGRGVLLKLAESADAFIQNFRPGVVERLGVGYDDLRSAREDIVYLSISGFGEKGPYAQKPAYDPIIQAITGLTTIQAGSDGERPRLVRTIVPDKVTALDAAQALTAGLLYRERTGQGQHIRLSMLDAVMNFLWASDMGLQTFAEKEMKDQRPASFIDLIYETKDGYMSVAVMNNAQWEGLSRAAEKPEWLEDDRFSSPALRDRNIDERLRLTQEVLRTRTTEDWIARLEAENVPCVPVLTRNEVIHHPQLEEMETLVFTDHAHAGKLRQARGAARFEGTPLAAPSDAPMLGADTDAVLAEAGFSDAEITRLRQQKAIGPGPENPYDKSR